MMFLLLHNGLVSHLEFPKHLSQKDWGKWEEERGEERGKG